MTCAGQEWPRRRPSRAPIHGPEHPAGYTLLAPIPFLNAVTGRGSIHQYLSKKDRG